MRIVTPVTDYIPRSVFTAKGELLVRGDALPEPLSPGVLDTYLKAQGAGALPIYEVLALRDTGVKIGLGTRSSSGSQVISGVGFQPSVVIFIGRDTVTTRNNLSWGFDDGSSHYCFYSRNNGTEQAASISKSIYIDRVDANELSGYISAMGSDGFTITWAETGSVSLDFLYLALP